MSTDGETHTIAPEATAAGRKHPMAGLILAQFLGAFNDNAWKQIVILLAIAASASASEGQVHTGMAQIIILIPAALISIPAGVFADRFSKRTILIGTKLFELGLMLVGVAALIVQPNGGTLALVVLGLLGIQAAPLRTGQVRDHPRAGATRPTGTGQRRARDGLEPGDPGRHGRRRGDPPGLRPVRTRARRPGRCPRSGPGGRRRGDESRRCGRTRDRSGSAACCSRGSRPVGVVAAMTIPRVRPARSDRRAGGDRANRLEGHPQRPGAPADRGRPDPGLEPRQPGPGADPAVCLQDPRPVRGAGDAPPDRAGVGSRRRLLPGRPAVGGRRSSTACFPWARWVSPPAP